MFRKFQLCLLENKNFQTQIVFIVVVLTIVRNVVFSYHIRQTQDYYSAIIFSLLFLWIFYSIFYHKIETTNGEVILRRKFNSTKELLGKFLKLILLYFFGYNSFFMYGEIGGMIMLSIISFTAIFSFFFIYKEFIMSYDGYDKFTEFFIVIFLVGYIFFIPWKKTYCEFHGVKEIGHSFEKTKYEAKYLVNIYRHKGEDEKIYTFPQKF